MSPTLTGNLDRINRVLEMSWIHLIMDSAMPLWVWTWGTECSTTIPRYKQKPSKTYDVNSHASSSLIDFNGIIREVSPKFDYLS